MIEKILERLEIKHDEYDFEDRGYIQPILRDAIEIVQEVAKEYGNGWIPCSSGQLPKHLETVWVTVKTENDYCYVTESFYDLNFGKWRVGKLCEVIAWQPKYMPPAPYQKGE